MAKLKVYEALAEGFLAEGVDALFGLMGDGNMHWMTAMKDRGGFKISHVRHEHSAILMAMGYHRVTGNVGVASVTCGPGFTQIMTALSTAARAQIPLVVFAGETPIDIPWYLQEIEQQPLAVACGAEYIGIRSTGSLNKKLQQAFYLARFHSKPVVVGVPFDFQVRDMPEGQAYVPSSAVLPVRHPIPADEVMMRTVANKIANAKVPVILAGKGVLLADGRAEVGELADRCAGVVMTTLLTRGMYDDNPFSLGIAGGYARDVSREVCERADLVVAFGASLNRYTLDGGAMFPRAELIQIDANPLGLHNGLKTADAHIRADAKLAAQSILKHLEGQTIKADVRSEALAAAVRDAPADSTRYPIEPGTIDPRLVFEELERVMPKDYDTVCGSGHNSYFHSVMRGGDPKHYHAVKEFGVVGSCLALAAGVAATVKHGRVVLYEGDGGFLMHIQELEYLKRQGVKMLIVVANDGAYGSEIHKLRQDGVDANEAVFGRTDLASIARGFGLRGATITESGQFEELLAEYEAQDESMVWDVHISAQVLSPVMRRALEKRGAVK